MAERIDERFARRGSLFASVRRGVDSLRTLRIDILELLYAIAPDSALRGGLLLMDCQITEQRLRDEWVSMRSVLSPGVFQRLTIAVDVGEGVRLGTLTPEADGAMLAFLDELRASAAIVTAAVGAARPDFEYLVLKLLLHAWLSGDPRMTVKRLSQAAGCSYPTAASVLAKHAGELVRPRDRSVSLREPEKVLQRVRIAAGEARLPVRFTDGSGQPRSAERHLERLIKLNPPGVAIGGVPGARHYCPELDLVGIPRLDLSVHSPAGRADLEFVRRLDGALRQTEDPREPASVVIHTVRHADSLFASVDAGPCWADPVECLLDLFEGGLEAQGAQLLSALKAKGTSGHRGALRSSGHSSSESSASKP